MVVVSWSSSRGGGGCNIVGDGGVRVAVVVVLAAVGQQPERRGENASGVDGRLDRVTRKLFEAHRKTPLEKFFGSGDMVAGGGRVAGGGGGLPEFMGRERVFICLCVCIFEME
ncbi:hypothetical protein Tco_0109196 [Tanacetum coccineum]